MNKSATFFHKKKNSEPSSLMHKFTHNSKFTTSTSECEGALSPNIISEAQQSASMLNRTNISFYRSVRKNKKPESAASSTGVRIRYKQKFSEYSCADKIFNNSIQGYRNGRISRNLTGNSEFGKQNKFKILLMGLELQFIENYKQSNLQKASEVLLKMISYAIDFNQKGFLLDSIRKVADFYYLCSQYTCALFYYNQVRQCALLMNDPPNLIRSLIKIAACCRKCNLIDESIKILKKSIQFSWFYEQQELQMKIYDQIGVCYYLVGDLQLASSFHNRFVEALYQKHDTPQRLLSNERIKKVLTQYKVYNQICLLFLIHLKIPIYKTSELAPIQSVEENMLRDQININNCYAKNLSNIKTQIEKILTQNFFSSHPDSLDLIIQKQKFVESKKSFDEINFKLNQHLIQIGLKTKKMKNIKISMTKYKQNLDQKVKRKLEEPSLDANWDSKMIKQIMKERKNNLFKIQNLIRVRGRNQPYRPDAEEVRKLFSNFMLDKNN